MCLLSNCVFAVKLLMIFCILISAGAGTHGTLQQDARLPVCRLGARLPSTLKDCSLPQCEGSQALVKTRAEYVT